MDPAFRARLERVYSEHPLNADAVLDRVRAERGTLEGISSRDLAESVRGGPTDQNHAGGALAVRALAAAVGVQSGWDVLDIGTGLGGTPRLLADEFGCRCHGVELTATRYRDAIRLTHLVGLDERVTFSQGDFMSVGLPAGDFDLAIGQGAFMHFADLPALLDRVAALVRPGGRLAIEDGVIQMSPSTPADREALAELLRHWNGELQHRDDWPGLLKRAGFRFDELDDMTVIATHEFEQLLAAADARQLDGVSTAERRGWELGLQLSRSGHLGSVRLLATRVVRSPEKFSASR
ncbi:MAG: SAM-dependent methyltransferase [Vicinamibacterales bacterium]